MSESTQVAVTVTESYGEIVAGQPSMRHRRFFSNATAEQVVGLLMGLKFSGPGGLMADSTADSEECGPDSNSRFMRNFKPLGHSFASVFAGAFDVRQELVECVGMKAAIRMSFSPCDPKHELPTGSFLWVVEPDANGACWAEFINTPESRRREIPELKLETGKKHVFLLGHNQLNEKASRRIVEVLNGGDAVFADYAAADGIRFRPGKCAG